MYSSTDHINKIRPSLFELSRTIANT